MGREYLIPKYGKDGSKKMRIYTELDLRTYETCPGAVNTLERIRREGKCDLLEQILDDTYPDGMTDTELDDLLCFEPDTVFEWVGLPTESSISALIDEVQEQMDDVREKIMELMDYFNEETEGLTPEEMETYWKDTYEPDVNAYYAELDEMNDRMDELKEELENL